jgi:radical SAM superfamily enzyme YgiQ (UPF0313 family)
MKRIIFLNDIGIYDQCLPNRYIGPYVLASQLEKNNYEVIVIDWFTRLENNLDYIKQFITDETIMIGISSTMLALPIDFKDDGKLFRSYRSSNYHKGYLWFNEPSELDKWTAQLNSLLKEKNPNGKLILGGAKTPFIWSRIEQESHYIAYKNFDYIVMGAGDKLIVELANRISSNKFVFTSVKNNVHFVQGIAVNSETCPETIWSKNTFVQLGEALPLEISRGCAFNCKFCNYEKRTSNVKSIDILKNELIRNYEMYGAYVYSFSDDCFNDNKNKVNEICNMFLSLPFKIEWITYARMDLVVKFPETFDLMVKSGCKGVCFGIESLNREACISAGKGVHPEKIKETLFRIYNTYKEQCFFQCSFIVGLPFETEESQMETIKYFTETDTLDFSSIGVLGVSMFDENIDEKFVDYSDYTRNPKKYGFDVITFNPNYWKHSTMDYNTAEKLSKKWNNIISTKKNSAVMSIWGYPSLRTFGFTFDEIKSIMRENDKKTYWKKIIQEREIKYLNDYFESMKNNF